jgi:PIN domain nuclease of toxin-antitoxin system
LNLLIDTHVVIWFTEANPNLLSHHVEWLRSENNTIFISAVSIFELTTKIRIGKLKLPPAFMVKPSDIYAAFRFTPMPLNARHAEQAGQLQGNHKDPFDRLLTAQSLIEDMPIMTIDQRIRDLGAEVMW